MKYELILQNLRTGKTWDIAKLVQDVSWTTNRTGSPGVLKFTVIKAGDLDYNEGNPVRFMVNDIPVFFGFVFTKVKDRWGVIQTTCYDQLRYLLASASYEWVNAEVGDIIRYIAGKFQLKTGDIETTGYKIPTYRRENKKCLDIISYAVEKTTVNTNEIYCFYDNAGNLDLKRVTNMVKETTIGEKSLLYDYSYKTDIDSDTYNRIKLARPNKDTGRADIIQYENGTNIQRWGLLQKYSVVNEEMNMAQIESQAKTELLYYNRTLKTLSCNCMGHNSLIDLRAGNMLYLNISDLGDISLNDLVILDKVEQRFRSGGEGLNSGTHEIKFDCRIRKEYEDI